MKCPYCKHLDTAVVDSRDANDSTAVRRRRVCEQCQKRFTTYERVEGLDIKIVKKDGRVEDFDRDKLRRGIAKATWKRPVSIADIDAMLDEVEQKIRSRQSTQIKSWEVGNLVINRLRKLDPMAYLLFASVYRDMATIEDFQREINKLIEWDQDRCRQPIEPK